MPLVASCLLANGLLFVPAWVVATVVKKINVVDVIWGPSFAVSLTVALNLVASPTPEQIALSVLIYLWAFRLALHLLPRAIHHEEDRRYTAMREGRSRRFFLFWSLIAIFGLQVVLSVLLSVPFLSIMLQSPTPGGITFAVGLGAALIGLVYESVADYQLRTFLTQRSDTGSVCQQGLWRFSRHPNYFGEFVFWWGIWLATIDLGAPLWCIYAPIGLTYLLLRVSGVALMESTIKTRRPSYDAYCRTTNAFFPGPRRSTAQNQ